MAAIKNIACWVKHIPGGSTKMFNFSDSDVNSIVVPLVIQLRAEQELLISLADDDDDDDNADDDDDDDDDGADDDDDDDSADDDNDNDGDDDDRSGDSKDVFFPQNTGSRYAKRDFM